MFGTTKSPGAFTLATFVAAVALGGGNFLAVRFSNGELPPFWGAGLRFSLAAMIFVVAAFAMRLQWPRGRQLVLTAVYGLFSFTLTYALMYWALVTVSAGTTTVVLATVPLVASLLAAAQGLERLSNRTLLGAVVALAGIVWMTVGPEGLVVPMGGLVAILVASLTIGQSVILGKKVSANHPVMTNAVAMSTGAPLLLVLSAMFGEQWALPSEAQTLLAVTYLVLLGSVGLFILMLMVVRRWTVSVTAYVFVLFPVVTMLLEAWIIGEPLTARGIGGAIVVMSGVWFGALASGRRGRARAGIREPATAEAS